MYGQERRESQGEGKRRASGWLNRQGFSNTAAGARRHPLESRFWGLEGIEPAI